MKKLLFKAGIGLLLCISAFLASVKHNRNVHKKAASESAQHGDVWYQGSMNEAMRVAERDHKLLFLYWGAQWCPPCNELKSEVFSHPKFAELVAPTIPVYLDGDTEKAQQWGEKLGVSGYPTVLLLDPKGQELWRLATSLSFAEFKQGLLAAYASEKPLWDLVEQALAGSITEREAQVLAQTSWSQIPEWPQRFEKEATLKRLYQKVTYKNAKSALASAYLPVALSAEKSTSQPKDILAALDTILETSVIAGREALLWSAQDFFAWVEKDKTLDKSKTSSYAQRWHEALVTMRHSSLPFVTRAQTYYGELSLKDVWSSFDMQRFQAGIAKLKEQVVALEANSYERKATASLLAYYLRESGQVEQARTFLLQETEQSNTPWYYFSSLATLEEKQKSYASAAEYMWQASESAKGRATEIQWLSSRIKFHIRNHEHVPVKYEPLFEELYSLVFAQDDGFSGRNLRSLQSIEKALGKTKVIPLAVMKKIDGRFKQRCDSLQIKSQQAACKEYFAKAKLALSP